MPETVLFFIVQSSLFTQYVTIISAFRQFISFVFSFVQMYVLPSTGVKVIQIPRGNNPPLGPRQVSQKSLVC